MQLIFQAVLGRDSFESNKENSQDRLYLIQDLSAGRKIALLRHSSFKTLHTAFDQIEQKAFFVWSVNKNRCSAEGRRAGTSSFEPSSVLEVNIEEAGRQDLSNPDEQHKLSDTDRLHMMQTLKNNLSREKPWLCYSRYLIGDRCWPQLWPVWADARDRYVDAQRRVMEQSLERLLSENSAARALDIKHKIKWLYRPISSSTHWRA